MHLFKTVNTMCWISKKLRIKAETIKITYPCEKNMIWVLWVLLTQLTILWVTYSKYDSELKIQGTISTHR